MTHRILGIHVDNKSDVSIKLQDILSQYGCSIRTRLGLNSSDDHIDSNCGIILLELSGDIEEMNNLESKLKQLEGVKVGKMEF